MCRRGGSGRRCRKWFPRMRARKRAWWSGIAGHTARVLHTPGHTQGSICLHFVPENLLLAGDTLFAGSIGRTDLPGGDGKRILRSLHDRLLTLPDVTRVIPGHGPETSIGEERESNPFLRPGVRI